MNSTGGCLLTGAERKEAAHALASMSQLVCHRRISQIAFAQQRNVFNMFIVALRLLVELIRIVAKEKKMLI